jgi:hypothetical protein
LEIQQKQLEEFTVNEKGTDDIEEQIKKGGRKLAKDEDEN